MLEALLAFLGLGQAQSHRSEDRFAVASSHLATAERISLETDVRLTYEIDRLERLAKKSQTPIEVALAPLINMQLENEQIKSLAQKNRDLLRRKGANSEVVTELERWAGTCQVIPTQIDLQVRKIEGVLSAT